MKILFAASECVPFIKTGGLADVVGALSKEIAKKGADIRVILPLYKGMDAQFKDQLRHVCYFYIDLGWRHQYVGIETLEKDGVTFYFIDNQQYFGRDYIYGRGGDEGERFAYFAKAVLETLPKIDFIPDVLSCHDWQTGMIPVLLKAQYRQLPLYENIKTTFTIHNLQFQGLYPISATEELLCLGDWAYSSDNLEFYGQCSFIKGGLVFADRITTVSPTYAQEILSPYYGERMDGLLRSRQGALSGILNGIDTVEYDPARDPFIEKTYTPDTFEDKLPNKLALQKELGLKQDENAPLIAMVTRLSAQKGLDLVERVLDGIMNTGAQMVVLGMGESKYMDLFGWASWKYSGRLAASFQMNHALAHKIYAGADLFLMPSMFEPCGLSQMIALRYGTLPIARETGGLRDTVLSYNEYTGDGNGFTFFNYNAHDMLHVIERATGIYYNNRVQFDFLARRAIWGEYGWDKSADKYLELFGDLCGVPQAQPIEEAPAPKPKKPRTKKAAPAQAETEPKAEPAAKAESAPNKETKPKKPKAVKLETADAAAQHSRLKTQNRFFIPQALRRARCAARSAASA